MTFARRLSLVIALSLFLISLIGCGEKTVVGQSGPKIEQSQACIDCHQSAVSPGTGKLVVDEWKLSHHNTSNAAGCADCHEPAHSHPSGCNLCHGGLVTASSVIKNPDENLKCAKCHSSTTGLFPKGSRRAHYGDPNAATRYIGFGSYTASYVSTNYIGNCRKCHNPHDPTSNIEYNRSWAESGHGEYTAGARRSRDFKLFGTSQPANLAYTNSSPSSTTIVADIAKGTPVCVRCHTTTGFINFVESAPRFTNVKPFGNNTDSTGKSIDKTKEVTGCDACHTSYNFKVRPVPQVTIYFNFSGATQVSALNPEGHAKIKQTIAFPDLKSSNLCIPCHSGRGVGSAIGLLNDANVDFSKINSPSSHDFSGAALLTAKSGYEFSGKEYTNGVGANTGHDSTGLSTGKGPCITCHLNKDTKSDSHTFKPVVHGSAFLLYTSNRTWSQVYSVGSDSQASLRIASIPSLSCNTTGCHAGVIPALTAADLNIDKEGYISALAVLNQWVRLVRNVPVNSPASTVCINDTNPPRLLTKWNYYGTGPDLMGSAFNLSTLNNEPGAYTHNPLYAKRLVYDSIAYLMLAESKSNVADAIQSLVGSTRRYYSAKTNITAGVSLLCSDYTSATVSISQSQADAAIKWLYGSTTPPDKSKRPGDN